MNMTASVMARDGTCARILCGEVLVAIPDGYRGKEVQILSQHILKLPKMKRLLQRSDPLLGFGKSSKSKRSEVRASDNSSSSLGIQPLSKQNVQQQQQQQQQQQRQEQAVTEIGTFSSSILFGAIHEELEGHCSMNSQNSNEAVHTSTNGSRRRLMNYPAMYDCNDDDYSVGSNYSRNAGHILEYTTSNVSRKISSLSADESMNNENNMDISRSSGGLTIDQIEEIKREAAAAARIAAEEAFAMRMEELMKSMNINPDEKAQWMRDPLDDISFHSAMSWTSPTCQKYHDERLSGTSNFENYYEYYVLSYI
jgi:hypothetical protein